MRSFYISPIPTPKEIFFFKKASLFHRDGFPLIRTDGKKSLHMSWLIWHLSPNYDKFFLKSDLSNRSVIIYPKIECSSSKNYINDALHITSWVAFLRFFGQIHKHVDQTFCHDFRYCHDLINDSFSPRILMIYCHLWWYYLGWDFPVPPRPCLSILNSFKACNVSRYLKS